MRGGREAGEGWAGTGSASYLTFRQIGTCSSLRRMGIGITREQRDLAEAVRGWIARTVPPEETRKLLDAPGGQGGRPAHWDALAAQGFIGVHLPEECGGGGGTVLDLAVVLEEAARAALPGPYAANALASLVLARAAPRPRGWCGMSPGASGSGRSPSGPGR